MVGWQAAVGEPDSVEEARKYLGRFGLSGDLATRPIKTLSGGEEEEEEAGGEWGMWIDMRLDRRVLRW